MNREEIIKEFAERIKGYYSVLKVRPSPSSVVGYVEQIEREMLEGKNESFTDDKRT